MTRKKARHLFLEMARRMHMNQHGGLQGFGKTASYYGADWRPDFEVARRWGLNSYEDCWNSEAVKQIRKSVGM